MKKIIIAMIALFISFTGFTSSSYAFSDSQSMAIQELLDDACRISGVPGMSLSILSEGETFFFSSGYASRETGLPASENTLYELASVSKAFTGTGILLLEEQGRLSMTDPVRKYLPWFTLKYQGKPVDMENLTLNNFLHHTSGLTNGKHFKNIPQGSTPDMLQKTVENLVNAELSFSPGDQYSYGTVNYDVLGLVIEIVSGQSYEDFMKTQIFQPLGLDRTYAYKEEARSSGQLAQGYRTSFLVTTPYNAPDYGGNKPAGYVISCAGDMARWMGIQMGLVQDIPEIFQAVIENSHQGDMSVADVNEMYYAAGWMVNSDRSLIEHSGQNPNFATETAIFPKEGVAVCLLSNGANTNIGLVKNVKDILNGNLVQSYTMSNLQILDIVLSAASVINCLSAVLFFVLGLRRKSSNSRSSRNNTNRRLPRTKKQIWLAVAWLAATVVLCILCWVFPMLIGYDWAALLVWQTYSIPAALISLAVLAACITWFVYNVPRARE